MKMRDTAELALHIKTGHYFLVFREARMPVYLATDARPTWQATILARKRPALNIFYGILARQFRFFQVWSIIYRLLKSNCKFPCPLPHPTVAKVTMTRERWRGTGIVAWERNWRGREEKSEENYSAIMRAKWRSGLVKAAMFGLETALQGSNGDGEYVPISAKHLRDRRREFRGNIIKEFLLRPDDLQGNPSEQGSRQRIRYCYTSQNILF